MPFLGLHSVQDVPVAGYPASPQMSGFRVCPVPFAAPLLSSDAAAATAAVPGGPRPPSRGRPVSPPGPLYASNPTATVYAGPRPCVQCQHPASWVPS
ncbi:hypothetical protein NDU88_003518 [Pleurodeles waltl]|uniref:Uncharacterized protein n=1 Tax=Pleurodeles waltl TaxID=8319 RepID=A0AAV7VDN2_PLEWA|nr:hypothetical protein NDU88_003518 [Pleurodeles waltl]